MRMLITVALVLTSMGLIAGRQRPDSEILVKFRDGVAAQDRESLLQKHGMSVATVFESIRVYVIKLRASMTASEGIQILSKEAIVEYAEPNGPVYAQPEVKDRQFREGQVVVNFKPRTNVERELKRYKMTVGRRLNSNLFVVRLPRTMRVKEAIALLTANPNVQSVQPDYIP